MFGGVRLASEPRLEIDGHELGRVLGGADGAVDQALLRVRSVGNLAAGKLSERNSYHMKDFTYGYSVLK